MNRLMSFGAAVLLLGSVSASALPHQTGFATDRHDIGAPSIGAPFRAEHQRLRRHHRTVRHPAKSRAKLRRHPTLRGYARALAKDGGRLSLTGFPAAIVSKVAELKTSCGARLTSAFRPGARVAGTGKPSLHASKQAVDMAGNPRCMYAHLKKWPGGVSTDYSRVRHVHFSYSPGGREWGSRFAHWTGKRKTRYAALRRHRSAAGGGGY